MKFLYTLFFVVLNFPFTLMINPAGDAQSAGRIVGDSFERGLTLQCAEKLQQKLQQLLPIRVVLSRFPGEVLEPLQVTNFSNRLQSDLFLSLHFYESDSLPKIHIYYYKKNVYENSFSSSELFLCPLEEAYRFNMENSKRLASNFYSNFKTGAWKVQEPLALPFLPLKGLVAPAIAIEIGLQKASEWREVTELVVDALVALIDNEI